MLQYLRDPILREYHDLSKYLGLDILFAKTEWLQAPSIEGEYRGRHIRVFSFYVSRTVGHGNKRRIKTDPYTSVFVHCDNFYRYQLSIAPGKPGRKILRKIKNLFFESDEEADERLLMDNYTLSYNDSYFADSLLNNGFRDMLLTHKKSLKSMLRLESNTIVYTERVMIDRTEKRKRIEEMTDLSINLAELIEQFTKGHRTEV